MKGIRVLIIVLLIVVASPTLAEQVLSETEKATRTLPRPEQTDTADVISYMEFKLLLESGKIKMVNLVSQYSNTDGSCFPEFFAGPGFDTIGGVYINPDGKERKYTTQRTLQASNDPFLIDAIRANNIPINIKKGNNAAEMYGTFSDEWSIWDNIWYSIFGGPELFSVLMLVIGCIILYQVVKLKRIIARPEEK